MIIFRFGRYGTGIFCYLKPKNVEICHFMHSNWMYRWTVEWPAIKNQSHECLLVKVQLNRIAFLYSCNTPYKTISTAIFIYVALLEKNRSIDPKGHNLSIVESMLQFFSIPKSFSFFFLWSFHCPSLMECILFINREKVASALFILFSAT